MSWRKVLGCYEGPGKGEPRYTTEGGEVLPNSADFSGDKWPEGTDVAKTEVQAWKEQNASYSKDRARETGPELHGSAITGPKVKRRNMEQKSGEPDVRPSYATREVPERFVTAAEPPADDHLMDVARQIKQMHDENGFSTYSLATGNMVGKPYYAVSIFPDLDRKEVHKDKLEVDDIYNFMKRHMDLLRHAKVMVGTWKSPEGENWLELSVPVSDKNKAIELGRRYNQQGVTDLSQVPGDPIKAFISTGGTGTPAPNMPPPVERLKEVEETEDEGDTEVSDVEHGGDGVVQVPEGQSVKIDLSKTPQAKVTPQDMGKGASMKNQAYIKHHDGKWTVMSESGKSMGSYESESGAKNRLRQVEYFKHKGSAVGASGWRSVLSDVDFKQKPDGGVAINVAGPAAESQASSMGGVGSPSMSPAPSTLPMRASTSLDNWREVLADVNFKQKPDGTIQIDIGGHPNEPMVQNPITQQPAPKSPDEAQAQNPTVEASWRQALMPGGVEGEGGADTSGPEFKLDRRLFKHNTQMYLKQLRKQIAEQFARGYTPKEIADSLMDITAEDKEMVEAIGPVFQEEAQKRQEFEQGPGSKIPMIQDDDVKELLPTGRTDAKNLRDQEINRLLDALIEARKMKDKTQIDNLIKRLKEIGKLVDVMGRQLGRISRTASFDAWVSKNTNSPVINQHYEDYRYREVQQGREPLDKEAWLQEQFHGLFEGEGQEEEGGAAAAQFNTPNRDNGQKIAMGPVTRNKFVDKQLDELEDERDIPQIHGYIRSLLHSKTDVDITLAVMDRFGISEEKAEQLVHEEFFKEHRGPGDSQRWQTPEEYRHNYGEGLVSHWRDILNPGVTRKISSLDWNEELAVLRKIRLDHQIWPKKPAMEIAQEIASTYNLPYAEVADLVDREIDTTPLDNAQPGRTTPSVWASKRASSMGVTVDEDALRQLAHQVYSLVLRINSMSDNPTLAFTAEQEAEIRSIVTDVQQLAHQMDRIDEHDSYHEEGEEQEPHGGRSKPKPFEVKINRPAGSEEAVKSGPITPPKGAGAAESMGSNQGPMSRSTPGGSGMLASKQATDLSGGLYVVKGLDGYYRVRSGTSEDITLIKDGEPDASFTISRDDFDRNVTQATPPTQASSDSQELTVNGSVNMVLRDAAGISAKIGNTDPEFHSWVIRKEGDLELIGGECSTGAGIFIRKGSRILQTFKCDRLGHEWRELINQAEWEARYEQLVKESSK